MEFKEASRKDVRSKMCVTGLAGAGKSLSAGLIAKGLVSNVENIGYAQTEAGRAQCYIEKIGPFKVLEVAPPFSPQKYIEIIEMAEKSGIKCLIIDSLSDEWAGQGGALDMHSAAAEVTKNSFSAWRSVTPKHEALFNKILQSPIHIIATIKKKSEYIIETVEKNGRTIQQPKKIGLGEVAREGTDYRWMLQFDIDRETHLASVGKDNTGLFAGKEPFLITEAVGVKIREWCLGK